ncbi:MAG: twin-arginine translocation signal domain-containing protein [Sedimentisphaerales bacterium]|nr:twin-arginine translocation signal domain-containing protein [Sedimentisphaerales bacterium]
MNTSRRDFIKAAAIGMAAGPALAGCTGTVAKQDAGRTGNNPIATYKAVLQRSDQRIKSVETFTNGNVSFVRIRTNDGAEGWGQISTYDADISAMIMHRKIAQHAIGKDPADIDAIVDRCIEANYKYPWSFVCRALGGLDTAMWDLLGKREGKAVCELLGGQIRPIRAYGSSMSRSIKPKSEAERLVRLREEKGYRAFKIRIGSVTGHNKDQWPGRTEEIVPTVREAIGDETALLVDGNSCYTAPKAIEVGRLLADNNVCHFEEPCPYWELEWTAKVTKAISVPVAGGEQDNDLAQWRRMIEMRAVDIVQPDILYVGGLTRALRVAAMADRKGMPCVPHSANLAMVTLFSMHMLAAIPNAGDYVEFSIEKTPWAEGLYRPALEVNDGKAGIPEGPGWGVTINPKWLESAQHQISEA